MSVISKVPIESIVVNRQVYPREQPNEEKIEEYYQKMRRGERFPRPVVTGIKGTIFLVDGFHRISAMLKLGETEAEVEVIKCRSEDEAYEESVRRNVVHGVALNSRDKVSIIRHLRNTGRDVQEIAEILRVTSQEIERIQETCIERSRQCTVKRFNCGDCTDPEKPFEDPFASDPVKVGRDLNLQARALRSVSYLLEARALKLSHPGIKREFERLRKLVLEAETPIEVAVRKSRDS